MASRRALRDLLWFQACAVVLLQACVLLAQREPWAAFLVLAAWMAMLPWEAREWHRGWMADERLEEILRRLRSRR